MAPKSVVGVIQDHAPRTLAFAVCALLLVLAANTFTSVPVAHATACGATHNWFDGINGGNKTGTTPAYGTWSYITTGNPALCTDLNNGDSSAWTMLSGNANCQYAQSGYVKQRILGDVAPHRFIAYNRGNCAAESFGREAGAIGGNHNYMTSYIEQVGKVYLYWDGSNVGQTNFDPILYWSAPWHSYWSGETFHAGDDMPGTAASPVYFDALKRKETVRGGWVTPTSTPGFYSDGCACYKKAWDVNRQKFHIWTQR